MAWATKFQLLQINHIVHRQTEVLGFFFFITFKIQRPKIFFHDQFLHLAHFWPEELRFYRLVMFDHLSNNTELIRPFSWRPLQRCWLDYPSLATDGNDPAGQILSCKNKIEPINGFALVQIHFQTSLTWKPSITVAHRHSMDCKKKRGLVLSSIYYAYYSPCTFNLTSKRFKCTRQTATALPRWNNFLYINLKIWQRIPGVLCTQARNNGLRVLGSRQHDDLAIRKEAEVPVIRVSCES